MEQIKKAGKTKTAVTYTLMYILLVFTVFICLVPFWILLVNSTRNSIEIQSKVSFWFGSSLKYNWDVLNSKGFSVFSGLFNSLTIAVLSTVLSIFFSAMTAYGFAAFKFKGRGFLFALILVILMIPSQLGIIGFYQLMASWSLLDNYIPLILPSIATAASVFFMKQYLDANFPFELLQAARIDGCGEIRTFLRIVIPIMLPALATMGIMGFIGSWNNYMGPLMLLQSQSKFTLPLLVDMLKSDIYSTEYGSTYLGIMMTVLPLVIIYLLLSKYIIRGVALGGVKE